MQARFRALRCGRRWGKTNFLKTVACDFAAKGAQVGWFVPNYRYASEAYSENEVTLEPAVRNSSRNLGIIHKLLEVVLNSGPSKTKKLDGPAVTISLSSTRPRSPNPMPSKYGKKRSVLPYLILEERPSLRRTLTASTRIIFSGESAICQSTDSKNITHRHIVILSSQPMNWHALSATTTPSSTPKNT